MPKKQDIPTTASSIPAVIPILELVTRLLFVAPRGVHWMVVIGGDVASEEEEEEGEMGRNEEGVKVRGNVDELGGENVGEDEVEVKVELGYWMDIEKVEVGYSGPKVLSR